MTTRTVGKHRAACRTKTPLSVIGDAVSATGVTRRSAVIAASSGLIVTMGLPAVGAAGLAATPHEPADSGTTQQLPAVPSDPTVTVPLDAQVSFALSALTTVDAAQFEHDAAVAEAERAASQARASRAAARAALAATATTATRAPATAATRAAASTASPSATRADDAQPASRSTVRAAAASTGSGAVIDIAKRYFGIDYRYGGTTPAGFDCSGFVQYVYKQVGVSLPRTATEQAAAGARVSASEARPGDVVSYLGRGGVYHNGIYTGNGMMIDSPRTGQAIAERPIFSSNIVFTRFS